MAKRSRFSDMMAAAAFAEAGEHETAREMLKAPSEPASQKPTVLVVLLGNQSDRAAAVHATAVAKRMEAMVEVLNLSSRTMSIDMDGIARTEGVDYRIVSMKPQCVRSAVIKHTRGRGEIRAVVVESQEATSTGCKEDRGQLSAIASLLPCPLVLVTQNS